MIILIKGYNLFQYFSYIIFYYITSVYWSYGRTPSALLLVLLTLPLLFT